MTLQCRQLYGFTAILCIRANYVNIISGFMFVTVLRLCCNVDKSIGLYGLLMQQCIDVQGRSSVMSEPAAEQHCVYALWFWKIKPGRD